MEGGGGREKRFLHSPPPPPSFLFFAFVPIFSTNSRGTACYAGYTEHSRGISYEAREACLVFSFRKSISILPSCFLSFLFLSFLNLVLLPTFWLFAWKFGWLTFQERRKFCQERVVGARRNWQWIFSLKCYFLWVWQDRSEFSKIRYLWKSILPEFVTYQLNLLNWKLSGIRNAFSLARHDPIGSQLSQGFKLFKLKRHHVATLPLQQEHFPAVSCPQMFCSVALDTLE